jgi:16S rRNA processing protein RimM
VYSYTRPPEAILKYSPWLVQRDHQWQEQDLVAGRKQGKGLVANLEGFSERDASQILVGSEIAIPITRLPPLPDNEYYWAQLEGLQVQNLQGASLGKVNHLFETGANDVMVVRGERERLLPFIENVIKQVNLDAGVIIVDWDERL